MTAPEQAPATVEGLMKLVDAYRHSLLSRSFSEPQKLANATGAIYDAIRDHASRLAAPPAPPQEPVAWGRGYAGELVPGELYRSRESAAVVHARLAAQYGDDPSRKVVALYASPPPPPEPQEVELLTDEACDLLRRRWAIPRDAIEAVIEAFCETNELTLKENTRG